MTIQFAYPYVEFGQSSELLNEKLNTIHELTEKHAQPGGRYQHHIDLQRASIFTMDRFEDYFEPGQIKLDPQRGKDNGRLYLNPVFIFTRDVNGREDVFTHNGQRYNGEQIHHGYDLSCMFEVEDLPVEASSVVNEIGSVTKEGIFRFVKSHLNAICLSRYKLEYIDSDIEVIPELLLPRDLVGMKLSYFPNDRYFTQRLNLVFEIKLADHLEIRPNLTGLARTMGWIPRDFLITLEGEGQETGMNFANGTHRKFIGF